MAPGSICHGTTLECKTVFVRIPATSVGTALTASWNSVLPDIEILNALIFWCLKYENTVFLRLSSCCIDELAGRGEGPIYRRESMDTSLVNSLSCVIAMRH